MFKVSWEACLYIVQGQDSSRQAGKAGRAPKLRVVKCWCCACRRELCVGGPISQGSTTSTPELLACWCPQWILIISDKGTVSGKARCPMPLSSQHFSQETSFASKSNQMHFWFISAHQAFSWMHWLSIFCLRQPGLQTGLLLSFCKLVRHLKTRMCTYLQTSFLFMTVSSLQRCCFRENEPLPHWAEQK